MGALLAVSSFGQGMVPAPRPRLTEQLRQQAMGNTAGVRANSRPLDFGRDLEIANREPANGPASDHGILRDPDAPSPMSRSFDWRGGGTYFKDTGAYFTTETMLQYDPPNRGWDLLRITF
jgi:hypothetical protein